MSNNCVGLITYVEVKTTQRVGGGEMEAYYYEILILYVNANYSIVHKHFQKLKRRQCFLIHSIGLVLCYTKTRKRFYKKRKL